MATTTMSPTPFNKATAQTVTATAQTVTATAQTVTATAQAVTATAQTVTTTTTTTTTTTICYPFSRISVTCMLLTGWTSTKMAFSASMSLCLPLRLMGGCWI
jgi:hypothetical protein